MGYYSHYELEVKGPQKQVEKLTTFLSEMTDWDKPYYQVYRAYFKEHREDTKWYEYMEDLKRLSTYFPQLLFSLKRKGEDDGDLEMSYYKNGKVQICPAQIKFDRYNPAKME